MDAASLAQIEVSLLQLIKRTGQFASEEFHRFSFDDVKFKRRKDPVSYVDINAEKMLKEGCSQILPGSGFINEESEDQASENGYTWIIDPIDGTTNFTHGVPHFSISVALYQGNEALVGYVYAPVEGEMFSAIRGQGAKLNGRPIQVSKLPFAKALVGTGFPHLTRTERDAYLNMVVDIMDHANGIRRMGSAALDLAYVAAGRYEAFFEYGLNPYDVAAGALIVQEAGGKVSNFTGEDDYLYGRQILATNGNIHQDMLDLIAKSLPETSSS
jgi:myo-inositol-1(or 4)-monophosphatase